jgi:hypothetical protein
VARRCDALNNHDAWGLIGGGVANWRPPPIVVGSRPRLVSASARVSGPAGRPLRLIWGWGWPRATSSQVEDAQPRSALIKRRYRRAGALRKRRRVRPGRAGRRHRRRRQRAGAVRERARQNSLTSLRAARSISLGWLVSRRTARSCQPASQSHWLVLSGGGQTSRGLGAPASSLRVIGA